MKLAWMTDIHIDHINPLRRDDVFRSFSEIDADALLITGDIADGRKIGENLEKLASSFSKPIYFVLGNHDFWWSSTATVRQTVSELCEKHPNLHYLSNLGHVELSPTCALVGHDCWYDAVYGDWKRSNFRMVDWGLIDDYTLRGAAKYYKGYGVVDANMQRVVEVSRELAKHGVDRIEANVANAVNAGYKRIIVASHVPPFEESHMHEGKIGDASAQPWFTCASLGDVLVSAALFFPDNVFVSFSGHTHGKFDGQKLRNLNVHVGGARYGSPEVQSYIDV